MSCMPRPRMRMSKEEFCAGDELRQRIPLTH